MNNSSNIWYLIVYYFLDFFIYVYRNYIKEINFILIFLLLIEWLFLE